VLQPVIQLGTAIHGESFSGGALNGAQKLLLVQKVSPSIEKVRVEKMLLSVRILANRLWIAVWR
jgi:hypothetical protein